MCVCVCGCVWWKTSSMGGKLVASKGSETGKIYGPPAEYDGSAWTGQDGG